MQTKLKISHVGFPPFSTGNCSQTLMPLNQQKVWRTINGEAITGEIRQPNKYKTFISGYDVNLPCFGAISIGSKVFIECIQRLWVQMDADGRGIIDKNPVEESVVALDDNKNLYELIREDDRIFMLRDKGDKEAIFLGYKPCLEMIVTGLRIENEEWGKGYKWELQAEEV